MRGPHQTTPSLIRAPCFPQAQGGSFHGILGRSAAMRLRDTAGNVAAVLEYALINKPEDFDLDALRAACGTAGVNSRRS